MSMSNLGRKLSNKTAAQQEITLHIVRGGLGPGRDMQRRVSSQHLLDRILRS